MYALHCDRVTPPTRGSLPAPRRSPGTGYLCRDFITLSGLRQGARLPLKCLSNALPGKYAMRRFAIGLVTLATLGTSAYAQQSGKPPLPEEIEKKKQSEALDRQYKSTLKRTAPDNVPVRTDPWSNMRGADNPKR